MTFAEALQKRMDAHPNGWLNGRKIFELHDTYGLPFLIIRDECKKRRVHFDESGIRAELRVCYGWDDTRISTELKE